MKPLKSTYSGHDFCNNTKFNLEKKKTILSYKNTENLYYFSSVNLYSKSIEIKGNE